MADKRAMIFANGEIPHLPAARALVQPGDVLIAADGGAGHLRGMGLTPHVLIGDLDSLTSEQVATLQQSGVHILRFPPEKDETDLELALRFAVDQGCTVLRILGGLGNRIDHTLANLFLLDLPILRQLDARLDDGREEVFLIRSSAEIIGAPGETVSLLPLGQAASGVVTEGLRYPLRGETLQPERSRGVSNELVAGRASVRLEHGTLICVHTRQAGKK